MKARSKMWIATLSLLVLTSSLIAAQMNGGSKKGMKKGDMQKNGMMSGGMMGMHGNGMMNMMNIMPTGNMALYRYLGLTADMQKMMLDIQQAMLDTRKQMLPLQTKMQKLGKQIAVLQITALTNKVDALKLLNLIKQNENLHNQMFQTKQQSMKKVQKLCVAHMKQLNNKVKTWIAKAQKDPKELQKYLEFVKTTPVMMNMMNGMQPQGNK